MKSLVGLIILTAGCWLVGLVLGAIGLLSKKRQPEIWLVALFFLIPFFAAFILYIQGKNEEKTFNENVAYVQELCAKYGGDHIYKTADNVEGVLRIAERNPDRESQLRDQFGMIDPYGNAQEDPDDAGDLLSEQRRESKPGYIYIEAPISYKKNGPPYTRFYLKPTGKKIGDTHWATQKADDPELIVAKEQVDSASSQYGYLIEDLSTQELRKRWIGGGKIKIIDIRKNEILAERTGYFLAPGNSVQLHWAASGLSGTNHFCPRNSNLREFLHTVLKPVAYKSVPQYSDFQ